MKLPSLLTTALLAATTAATALPHPASSPSLQPRQDTGSYTIPGLGARKRQVTAAGASVFDLAIAMLETERMDTDYVYGDNKQDDSANFGIFKQNWGMLRACCDRFRGQEQSSWNNGALLNSDLQADVTCLKQCQSFYGMDRWLAGHRNGATGLSNPNTPDIQNYVNGVRYIEQQLSTQPGGLTNDVRYWIFVVPI
ncbi:hypothetical protein IAQ61_007116 [Plenodomus lingam]|uniref:Uncharacterized protein n=1 Tax=Leptosphaeria maculans (strain JN3 / isolate v23.1.3 / race Av1-4-5-6-7-8) TaxID=985895 RepID=E5A1L2_LEPMJ|nr:hypothetical protein LEMA_P106070.1 [Plenodomus lingam JN3]KAH9867812.1 hypothetical protein IAQ61_007116 [Plenodomus lingam]CBX97476.1 hypothetical protein LEMA_P106070.1 [Plenodomus lingam JN3]